MSRDLRTSKRLGEINVFPRRNTKAIKRDNKINVTTIVRGHKSKATLKAKCMARRGGKDREEEGICGQRRTGTGLLTADTRMTRRLIKRDESVKWAPESKRATVLNLFGGHERAAGYTSLGLGISSGSRSEPRTVATTHTTLEQKNIKCFLLILRCSGPFRRFHQLAVRIHARRL